MPFYDELPCTIEDVIHLLGIQVVRDTGSKLHCRCPFCDDRGAHFNAKLDDNVFHCYRCGKGGGVLHLYAEFHNVSLRTAGDELRQIFQSPDGMALRASRPERKEIMSSELPIASAEVRDNTYSNLLSLLTLGNSHRQSLMARGLADEEIDRLGYRTTPAVRLSRIVTELQERGCSLAGVPGFYCDESTGEWKLDIRGHGIMLPDRNADGQIEAIQIRLDIVHKSKFNNLTSTDRYYGTSANCCPHFVGISAGAESVLITEGVMKADICHYFSARLGTPRGVVGLTGVSMKGQYLRALGELKALGIQRILLAYDADYRTNKAVAESREYALETGSAEGFEMVPLNWDPEFKGIDDLLLSFLRRKAI